MVLTGSSARDLTDAQKQLAGRLGSVGHSDRLLLPMGFRRFARAMGLDGLPQPDPVRARDFMSSGVDAAFVERRKQAFGKLGGRSTLQHASVLYLLRSLPRPGW